MGSGCAHSRRGQAANPSGRGCSFSPRWGVDERLGPNIGASDQQPNSCDHDAPHSSHFLQPCDQFIFATLENCIRATSMIRGEPNRVTDLLSSLHSATSPKATLKSWLVAGLWPVCCEKVLHNECVSWEGIRAARRRYRVKLAPRVLTGEGHWRN